MMWEVKAPHPLTQSPAPASPPSSAPPPLLTTAEDTEAGKRLGADRGHAVLGGIRPGAPGGSLHEQVTHTARVG